MQAKRIINTDIRIKVVTDKQELRDKGHDAPVIEIYNDIIDTWVSCKDLSFTAIEREFHHIKRVTDLYQSKKRIEKELKMDVDIVKQIEEGITGDVEGG